MIAEALQQLAGVFSRRFFFNALLPTFVFTTLTAGVVALSGVRGPQTILWWGQLDLLTKLLFVLVYLALIYFLSAAVASQWRNIVRVFEGYPFVAFTRRHPRRHGPRRRWGRPRRETPRLAVGQRWHRKRRKELLSKKKGDTGAAYYRYSKPVGDVLPTRLGNILLAGESYAMTRYGIDTIIFWPRLYPLLPEGFQNEYENAVIQYEFPLVVALEASMATMVCSVTMLVVHVPAWVFLVVLLGGSAIAYAAYVLSLAGATDLAERQRAAFDLYRDRLLVAWPSALDVIDQKTAFRDIRRFVLLANPPGWDEARDKFIARRPVQEPE